MKHRAPGKCGSANEQSEAEEAEDGRHVPRLGMRSRKDSGKAVLVVHSIAAVAFKKNLWALSTDNSAAIV